MLTITAEENPDDARRFGPRAKSFDPSGDDEFRRLQERAETRIRKHQQDQAELAARLAPQRALQAALDQAERDAEQALKEKKAELTAAFHADQARSRAARLNARGEG